LLFFPAGEKGKRAAGSEMNGGSDEVNVKPMLTFVANPAPSKFAWRQIPVQ
jgi:hypothetical protein